MSKGSKGKKPNGVVLEYFHPARIALNEEVRHHARLLERLGSYKSDDFTGKLGEIAAYFNIELDGMYTPEDLNKLCGILTHKLRDKRRIILQ